MSTVINNPTPSERTVVQSDSGGWAVAVIILLLVIASGAFWYFRYYRSAPQQPQPGPTINVTLPAYGNNNRTGGAAPQQ